MVDTCANDWQAERCIHGGIESESFKGNVALVMVHADEGISAAAFGGNEGRIRWQWTFDVNALGTCGLYRRNDQGLFLAIPE